MGATQINSILAPCPNGILQIEGRSNESVMLQLLESHCLPILTNAIEVIHIANRDERRRLRVAYNSLFRRIFDYRTWESVRPSACSLPPNLGGISSEAQGSIPNLWYPCSIVTTYTISLKLNLNISVRLFFFFLFSIFVIVLHVNEETNHHHSVYYSR